MRERGFCPKKNTETLLFGRKKCIIYANGALPFQNGAEKVLNFTNIPKKKQQFDDFEQGIEIVKGKTKKRNAGESAFLRKFLCRKKISGD